MSKEGTSWSRIGLIVVAFAFGCYVFYDIGGRRSSTVLMCPVVSPQSDFARPAPRRSESYQEDDSAPRKSAARQVRETSVQYAPVVVVKPVPPVRGRLDIAAEVLESEKLEIGIELGVKEGNFAIHNLKNWPSCKKYVLVDLWAQQKNYNDHANVDDNAQERIYQQAMGQVRPFKSKVEVCRNFTTSCALLYPDEYFDFVFVDARHDYKGVQEDLEAWWPKVKKGGIFSGHDYMTAREVLKETPDQDWGLCNDGTRNEGAVKGAVDEFFMSGTPETNPHFRQLTLTYREAAWNTWLVRK